MIKYAGMDSVKTLLRGVFEAKEKAFKALVKLLELPFEESREMLEFADSVREKFCGGGILLRAIVEFSSYCKNGCHYCGLNAGNKKAVRYRMNETEIFEAAKAVREAGIKTVVLQSGEDAGYDWDMLTYTVKKIKRELAIRVTLSCGEQEESLYGQWKKAGADRYLLKIETSNKELYGKLHPAMSFENRLNCLRALKKLGFQTGSGIIAGLKGQTKEDIAKDILFFAKENFDMIGINPFIAHPQSALKDHPGGDCGLALKTVALTRIITKNAHLPATTALGSIGGTDLRIAALKAGANVIMPNFTPCKYRDLYEIYPGKRCMAEKGDVIALINEISAQTGRPPDFSAGDSLKSGRGSDRQPEPAAAKAEKQAGN